MSEPGDARIVGRESLVTLFAQGRFADVEEQARLLLARHPDDGFFWKALGVALQARGGVAEAAMAMERAVELQPDDGQGWINLGILCQKLGRLDGAEGALRRALTLDPGSVAACFNLANVLAARQRSGEAEAAYRQALRLNPEQADVHFNLGVLLHGLDRLPEAEEAFRAAIRCRPDHLQARGNLGKVLNESNRPIEAEKVLGEALRLQPEYAEAINNLGVSLNLQQRGTEAEAAWREAMRIDPGMAGAFNNLGVMLAGQDRVTEAEALYREAVRLAPMEAGAWRNLGNLCWDRGDLAESLTCYRRALAIRPDFQGALSDLTYALMYACDWPALAEVLPVLQEGLRAGRGEVSPFKLLFLPVTPLDQRTAATRYCARHNFMAAPAVVAPRPARRLRIGYLSSDFREHAVASLLVEVLERHDRERFEIFAYSNTADDGSTLRARIVAACDHFRPVHGLADPVAARCIAEDGVEILVDLQGFTKGSRLGILALRPAPVQVTWLGYPGTLGDARLADYLIGDPIVTPPEHAGHFGETLALLPHCYQPNDRKRRTAAIPTRSMAGLPEEGLVFCSFNQGVKFNPESFDLWCQLLRAVPESRLWLPDQGSVPVDRLRGEAGLREVDPERLIFAPRLPDIADHLARLALADLALDTFPYTSHTTGSDALWVGVPLVTRIGETFASRVGASLLHAVGLPELVTTDWEGWFDLALRLARDPNRLQAIRRHLLQDRERHPLFDTVRFTRNLERLYGRMWEQYRAGRREMLLPDGPS
ncbi:MAG: tetratricopeptide repeat protein [Magnetococcales bacterium]|nr:tetratricopeptide repeat protein [Magnetococcales bacterium]